LGQELGTNGVNEWVQVIDGCVKWCTDVASVVGLAEVDVDISDPKILEKGKNDLRRVMGGRSGKSRLEINSNHDRTDFLFIANLFGAEGLGRREVDLETSSDEFD